MSHPESAHERERGRIARIPSHHGAVRAVFRHEPVDDCREPFCRIAAPLAPRLKRHFGLIVVGLHGVSEREGGLEDPPHELGVLRVAETVVEAAGTTSSNGQLSNSPRDAL